MDWCNLIYFKKYCTRRNKLKETFASTKDKDPRWSRGGWWWQRLAREPERASPERFGVWWPIDVWILLTWSEQRACLNCHWWYLVYTSRGNMMLFSVKRSILFMKVVTGQSYLIFHFIVTDFMKTYILIHLVWTMTGTVTSKSFLLRGNIYSCWKWGKPFTYGQ